jgi:hypothetical protein
LVSKATFEVYFDIQGDIQNAKRTSQPPQHGIGLMMPEKLWLALRVRRFGSSFFVSKICLSVFIFAADARDCRRGLEPT